MYLISWLLFLVHPCEKKGNGGCEHMCNKDGDKVRCTCKEGFVLEEDGKSCETGKFENQVLVI